MSPFFIFSEFGCPPTSTITGYQTGKPYYVVNIRSINGKRRQYPASDSGQEKIGTTWSIFKMNMLLHGISHADIRQPDTIREPQHLDDNNELKRFDRVLTNTHWQKWRVG